MCDSRISAITAIAIEFAYYFCQDIIKKSGGKTSATKQTAIPIGFFSN